MRDYRHCCAWMLMLKCKKIENIEKYRDLSTEISRLLELYSSPSCGGVPGTFPKRLTSYLGRLDISILVEKVQRLPSWDQLRY